MRILKFLFFFTLLYTVASAQTTIDNKHIPNIGDSFFFNLDTSSMIAPPLQGGIFDFSSLKKVEESVMSFEANDNLIAYPTSNMKVKTSGLAAADIYVKKSANDIFLISLSSQSIPIQLPSQPTLTGSLKYLTFPISSNTSISSSDNLKIIIPSALIPAELVDSLLVMAPAAIKSFNPTLDSVAAIINITMKLTTIGSGKIKTPIDSNFDVLKVERSTSFDYKITAYLSATVPFLGKTTIPIDVTQLLQGMIPDFEIPVLKEHIYYAASLKQPIVSATLDSIGNYQSTSYRQKTILSISGGASVVKNDGHDLELTILNNRLEINNLKPNTRYISNGFNMQGQSLWAKEIDASENHIDLNSILSNSIYVLFIREIENNSATKVFKFSTH